MILSSLLLAALSTSPALAPAAVPTAPVGEGFAWYEDGYNKALREAQKADRLVFIAFVPDTSNYSNKLLAETIPDARVGAELEELICLKYDTEEDARFQQLRRTYNVESYPTFVITDARGRIEDRIEGFIPPDPMVEQMQRIKAAEGTVSWHRRLVEEDPENLEEHYSLAKMLEAVRDYREAEKVYGSIRKADPEGHTATGARLILEDVWNTVAAEGGDDQTAWNLEPVYGWLENPSCEAAAFEGWNRVGNFLAGLEGRFSESIDAFMHAWETVPEDGARGYGRDVASFVARHAEEQLEPRHGEFALALATRSAEEAQRERDEYLAENGTTVSEDGGDYDAWLAEHLGILAWCQLEFGDAAEAVAITRRCVELAPENEEFQGRLEELLAKP